MPPTPTESWIELIDASVSPMHALVEVERLAGVNWRVGPGEFWAVGGPPGSGKTDLLTTAAGLHKALRGRQLLFGLGVGEMTESEMVSTRQRIGLVFADGGRLFPNLTVEENIALPLCYHRDCDFAQALDRVRETLAATGLERWASFRPARVTRNLHQKIALARALALQPQILLLDSPLHGLDPRQSQWWQAFLNRLAKGHRLMAGRPTTIIVASDDLRPWLEEATHFALLQAGAFHTIGDREALLRNSSTAAQEVLGRADYKD